MFTEKKAKWWMQLSTIRKFLGIMPIRTVFIDLSGTLHIDNTVTPGSIDALIRLRNAPVKIKFVTNTTKESRRYLHERLTTLGFEISENEIFTSLFAARSFIDGKGWKKPMLLLEPTAMGDFEGFKDCYDDDENADAVVLGLSPSQLCYPVLNMAFRSILNGAPLIAMHQARYFKEPSGLSLGPGGFVKALEYAADCQAQIIGKPEASFFLAALNNLDPKEAIMIGDDVHDDVKGAQEIGMRAILVKTGKYRRGDENKITPPPYRVCKDFSAAVDHILTRVKLNTKPNLFK